MSLIIQLQLGIIPLRHTEKSPQVLSQGLQGHSLRDMLS